MADRKRKRVARTEDLQTDDNDAPQQVSDADLRRAIEVIDRIRESHLCEYETKRFRPFRKSIGFFLKKLESKRFEGTNLEDYNRMKSSKFAKKREAARLRENDRKLVETRKLRQSRIEALNATMEESASSEHAKMLIPDGAVDDGVNGFSGALKDIRGNIGETATTTINEQRSSSSGASSPAVLYRARSCYACKSRFTELHDFYDQFCPKCAELNWSKRIATANLVGRIAIVTGGRVKIGYHIALKLLRSGCKVIVTTRFPVDAAERYQNEADFESFQDRIKIHPLDLKDISSIDSACEKWMRELPHLDFLINNACQTIKRPVDYYRSVLAVENDERRKLATRKLRDDKVDPVKLVKNAYGKDNNNAKGLLKNGVGDSLRTLFPVGTYDQNAQQLDLRDHNSWTMRLDQISTVEAAEVVAINALAPFVLNSKLKKLLTKSPFEDRYIVNVSAMEGKFTRHKTPNHPHTNAAKSFLNMITRTSAQDYARDGVYMNSVDTGWNSQENPLPKAVDIALNNKFQTPIDEIDGAARVVDPIFAGTKDSSKRVWGLFLKDFVSTTW